MKAVKLLALLIGVVSHELYAVSGSPEPILAEAGHPPVSGDFRFYDATLYKGKPDLGRYGIIDIPVVYVSRIWKGWKNMNDRQRSALPDRLGVLETARSVHSVSGRAVIDVEHWDIRARGREIHENVGKYVQLLEWFREGNPDIEWGYFARPPVRDYKRSILGRDHHKYFRWQKMNDALKPLAKLADIIYPSLYTRYNSPSEWQEYARQNIAESRRLAGGKPVIVFLWPRFKKSDQSYSLEYIPADFWRLQLETVYELADGLVIWGGWDSRKGGRAIWSEQLVWWQELKRFLKEKAINKVERVKYE